METLSPVNRLRIALAQINPTVGAIKHNGQLIRKQLTQAATQRADLVVFPELALTGYPPEDLLLRRHFLEECLEELSAIRRWAKDNSAPAAVIGYPELDLTTGGVYNSAALIGEWQLPSAELSNHPLSYRKICLPNYGVFDEQRYFQAGDQIGLFQLNGTKVGVTICEDIWIEDGPHRAVSEAGAELILNLSASPYHSGKTASRERMLSERAKSGQVTTVFCNQVGGQDELVFDGCSAVFTAEGSVVSRAAQFQEDLLIYDANSGPESAPEQRLEGVSEIYTALKLGLSDYVAKNSFEHVLLGLSGGIDSAVVAGLAADALGSERVTAVVMPSPYSSDATQNDALKLAERLGVKAHLLPIADVMASYDQTLSTLFAGHKPDLTEENLQARIRGNLLMALSNRFGWLVLTTGNKSEMAVGYSTLYGDSAGGLAVIKDCPKLLVYQLAEHINTVLPGAPIPESIITRPPTAELRPDQLDSDSLPPYELLDAIIEGYVEQDLGADQLIERGYPSETVKRIIRLIDLAEYKRRQSPPGIKITPKAFGRDRRMPITNGYR